MTETKEMDTIRFEKLNSNGYDYLRVYRWKNNQHFPGQEDYYPHNEKEKEELLKEIANILGVKWG
jgi:hypothetical protein